MKVSGLGEFGLIDLLSKMVGGSWDMDMPSWQKLLLGIGDDTAAWQGDASIQLATIDSIVQDVHFSLSQCSWEDLGWKALAVSLSDIAAMGGLPRYALVSLVLPGDTEVDDVASLYRGMIDLARQHGVAIIGGNMSSGALVVVDTVVLGTAGRKGKQLLTRSMARPEEKIAVTGYLGTAAAGLQLLGGRHKLPARTARPLRQSFLRPAPRIAEGQLLSNNGIKTTIDVSDGLISDLRQICKASRVGARIEVDRVPIHPAVKSNFGKEALELALSGGEDYELLFTGRNDDIEKVKKAASCPVTVIGEITADRPGEVVLIGAGGKTLKPGRAGWEHFASD